MLYRILLSLLLMAAITNAAVKVNHGGISGDTTIIDYDGNIYHTVKIGNQTWLKENLNSIHYSDGTPIPGVVSYNNNDSLGNIYGRLYTWPAAMYNSTSESAQGACPCGWHVPSDAEWRTLENYLGGASIAGGKMKDTGTAHWMTPNKSATNSSGLTILAAGEYDAHYTPNVFQLLMTYAVFWTSTSRSSTLARERYLAYDTSASMIYDWYKVMKYSVRCVKDTGSVGIKDHSGVLSFPDKIRLVQNYPNPFNPATMIEYQIYARGFVNMKIFDVLGGTIETLVNKELPPGRYSVEWNPRNLPSGIYFCSINCNGETLIRKMNYLK